jgi:hypothetical protein
MNSQPPIVSLICSRCKELGLSRSALVARCGYKNTAKGLRRLDALLAGDIASTRDLISRLPAGLNLSATVVTTVVEATESQLRAIREKQERAVFRPHAIILTEKTIPRPIFIAAVTGVTKWKRIDLDVVRGSETFLPQTMTVVKNRLAMFGGTLPMFGAVTGFIINYTYDLSVRYDLNGEFVEAEPHICRFTEPIWTLGKGKALTTIVKL